MVAGGIRHPVFHGDGAPIQLGVNDATRWPQPIPIGDPRVLEHPMLRLIHQIAACTLRLPREKASHAAIPSARPGQSGFGSTNVMAPPVSRPQRFLARSELWMLRISICLPNHASDVLCPPPLPELKTS